VNADAVAEFASRINATDSPKGVVYVAGGGSEVFPMLLARGGGSATLLAGRILYAPDDFRAALGCDPERFVDARASRGMAMAAFRHALSIRGDLPSEQVFGLGSTSKLSTGEGSERVGRMKSMRRSNPPISPYRGRSLSRWGTTEPGKRGSTPCSCSTSWDSSRLTRAACHWSMAGMRSPGGARSAGRARRAVDERLARRPSSLGLARCATSPAHGGTVVWTSEVQELPRLLLPGSFRPLHEGHVAMAEAASRLTGLPCCFELSLFHPEKLPLDFFSIRSRLKGFERRECRLYLTNAPTYVEKARLFPGCTFVVGHDTALRIVDPRFYGGSTARDAMLDELERLRTRFLIFGRVDASGAFRDFSAEEFEHPVSGFLSRRATPVPGHVFRRDISSTDVRRLSDDEYL